MVKNKFQSSWDFRFMSLFFKIQDLFDNPMKKVEKTGVEAGKRVLDYGCGSGSYTFPAADVVGKNGKVFAADIHPYAIKKINKMIRKKKCKNIESIKTDKDTGLDNEVIDIIFCFDMFHDVENKGVLLQEFHRVLKPEGLLAFDDHHATEAEIKKNITENRLFTLEKQKDKLYIFKKEIKKNDAVSRYKKIHVQV